jgi:hypothetical protein
MTRRAIVHRISASAPDDVSGIEAAIASQRIDPKGVIAVLAKTEGNGLVNDFSRGHATLALSLLFERHLATDEAAQSASSCLEAPRAPWLPIGWCSSALGATGLRDRHSRLVAPLPHRCRSSISAGCPRSIK